MSVAGGAFRYDAKPDDLAAPVQVPPDVLSREVDARTRRVNLFKVYLGVAGVLLLFSLGAPAAFVVLLIAAGIGAYFVHRWDRERRTARIFYDVDNDEIVGRLALANAAGETLARAARLWHIYASTPTYASKYHAGAGSLIERTATRCWRGSLQGIDLNVAVWSVPIGPQQLLFLPDRLLVRQGNRSWSVGYEHIRAAHETSQFVETGPVPPDGQVVDRTWRYVNKDGGPDRRFNNNHQIPVLSYGKLTLICGSDQIVVQASNPAATHAAATALEELGRIAREGMFQAGPPPASSAFIPPARVAQPAPWPPAGHPGAPFPSNPVALEQRGPDARALPPRQPDAAYRPARPAIGRPLPPPLPVLRARPRTAVLGVPVEARFFGVTDGVTVAGRTIPNPLTYVAPAASFDTDASTIVTTLPVGVADRAMPLPYWPRYSEADPDQRARYLDWMASGRSQPEIALGYVFIFFYGLERRLLIDDADEELVRAEVQRLLGIYGANRSFRSYASDLLAFAPVRRADRLLSMSEAELHALLRPLAADSSTALAAVTAWYHVQRRPLPAEHAAAVVRDLETAKRGAVVTRSATELLDLFTIRYRESFGEGLLLEAAKRPLTVEYRPASGTLLDLGRKLKTSLPDVLGRSAQFRKVLNLWNDCVDDLRKANAKKRGAKALDAAAWSALPAELRAEYDHPDQDRWDTGIAAMPVLDGFHLATIGQLADLSGIERSEKMSAVQMKRIAGRAAELGYAMEPDARVRSKPMDARSEALVWRTSTPEMPDVKVYAPAYAMLSLAMSIALADGVFTDEEHEVINSFLAELFTLDDGMRIRVEAMKQLMARDPSRLGAVAKTLRASRTPGELAKVGSVLVAIAAADGTIADTEEKALRSLYRNLGLPPGDLSTAIARTGARFERDGVVQVQSGDPGAGPVPIPPPPDGAPKLLLDRAAIDAIVADTKDVAAILAEVFDSEVEEPSSSAKTPGAPDSRLPIPELPRASEETAQLAQGLDVRYHAALEELLTRRVWPAADVRRIAERHRLMPAAILDTINAWSDAALGDFLIDDAGDWTVNRELVKVDA